MFVRSGSATGGRIASRCLATSAGVGAPRTRLQSDYGLSMRRRRMASIGAAAVAFAAVSLVLPATAFAAAAHFRYSHGEPLNDLRVTPGVTFHVAAATICRSGYATSVRDVPESKKNQVYAEYGITHHATDQYEVDHLISLELGGSNAIGNLWPELNDHPKGYLNSKDILENRSEEHTSELQSLRHLVCRLLL